MLGSPFPILRTQSCPSPKQQRINDGGHLPGTIRKQSFTKLHHPVHFLNRHADPRKQLLQRRKPAPQQSELGGGRIQLFCTKSRKKFLSPKMRKGPVLAVHPVHTCASSSSVIFEEVKVVCQNSWHEPGFKLRVKKERGDVFQLVVPHSPLLHAISHPRRWRSFVSRAIPLLLRRLWTSL